MPLNKSTTEDMKRFMALVDAAEEKRRQLLEEEEAAKKQARNKSHAAKRDRNSITSSDREEEEEEEDDDDEEEEEEYSAKSKKLITKTNRKNCISNGPQPPPPLPERFRQAMEEIAQGKNIEIKLVIQKGLYQTDLSDTQNRLSIPFTQISQDFLSEEEQVFLTTRDASNKMKYKQVIVIEPSLKRVKVKLSRWDMRKGSGNTSSCYVINGTWKYIVDRNKLGLGMVLQIWAFRIEGELFLALVKL